MNRKKILVADDDAVIQRTLAMKFHAAGYDVLTASDGSQAVSTVRRENPDLVLLDIDFPVEVGTVSWDGFRLMDWLHRLNEVSKIPIIIITGSDAAQYRDRALAAGAVAFFHKPIDHGELMKTIHETLKDSPPEVKPATA